MALNTESPFWGFLLQIGVAVTVIRIGSGGNVLLLLVIPAMWIAVATYAKRWHDLNKSGWMLLTLFIPFVNLLIVLYLGIAPGTSGYNIYGADPGKESNSFGNANSDNDMPVDVYGAFYQSVKLLKQGDAKSALALLEGALDRTSDNEEKGAIYYNIAVSHRRMGNNDLALQSLVSAV